MSPSKGIFSLRRSKVKGAFAVDFIRQSKFEQYFAECLQPVLDKMSYLVMSDPGSVSKQHSDTNISRVRRRRSRT